MQRNLQTWWHQHRTHRYEQLFSCWLLAAAAARSQLLHLSAVHVVARLPRFNGPWQTSLALYSSAYRTHLLLPAEKPHQKKLSDREPGKSRTAAAALCSREGCPARGICAETES
uniref:Putative secreted protein n=1 Tax=Anopheles marajoara TaxID=58244 RepID=A0A2M4C7Q3_9DIPT